MTRSEKAALTRNYGKVIETFSIEVEGTDYHCELRFRLGSAGNHKFTAVHAYGDPATKVITRNDDANEVRKELKAGLQKRFIVEWEDFILTKVSTPGMGGYYGDSSEQASLGIGFDYIQIGTRPDGSNCYREVDEPGVQEDEGTVREGVPSVGKTTGYGLNADKRCGLIPYSAESVDQLRKITEGLRVLRDQAVEILTGEDADRIVAGMQDHLLSQRPLIEA